jgi:6-phosphogluconolactonase
MRFIYLLLISIGILTTGCKENPILFAGGYSEDNTENLMVFDFNQRNGTTMAVAGINAGPNPSYFCFSDKHDLIYALNEVMNIRGEPGGAVTTLKHNRENRQIEKLDEMLVPYGGPCYISLSADGGFLLLANYSSGSVAVVRLDESGIPVNVTDSILYEVTEPDVSHPHMIMHDPAGKHVYLTDLGLDRIMIYDLDKNTGKMNLIDNGIVNVPKGSGPRHFVFNTSGTTMYLINELGSTMMVFEVDEHGGLILKHTISTLEENFQGKSYCADVHISRDGKYLYGSNRGENSIVVFNIDNDGLLSVAGRTSCGGNWPRNFVIDPSGQYLLVGNQRSDEISLFRIDDKTGIPEGPVNKISFKSPACLKFRN